MESAAVPVSPAKLSGTNPSSSCSSSPTAFSFVDFSSHDSIHYRSGATHRRRHPLRPPVGWFLDEAEARDRRRARNRTEEEEDELVGFAEGGGEELRARADLRRRASSEVVPGPGHGGESAKRGADAASAPAPGRRRGNDSGAAGGWMVRYGRRKIGRSFFHHRYFVLDKRLLAYYKKQPRDNMVFLFMAGKRKADATQVQVRLTVAIERTRNRASPTGVVKLYDHLNEAQKLAIENMDLGSMLDIGCPVLHDFCD